MKKQDILSILITFVVGVLLGGYVYLTGFAPTVAKLEVPTQEKVTSLVIESEVYGGCRTACPSFQLLGDGTYRYLYSIAFEADPVVTSGELPAALRRDVRRTMTLDALEAQSQRLTPAICSSYSDGIDVRYTITLDGEDFVLDTCGTRVDVDSPLWLNLERVWGYLEVAGNS